MHSVKPSTAVFIGAAIGMALSYVVLFIFGLIFLWTLVAQGVPGNESYARAYESTPYLVFAHLVGFLCLLPGGLWIARLSAHTSIRHALYAGLLVALFSLIGNLVPYYLPIPFWSKVASVLLPVPAFILGARLHTRAA
jgi:ABC-type methionine transport system permease subunit